MLSDGFEEDVERILATSPSERQTLLFRYGGEIPAHGCRSRSVIDYAGYGSQPRAILSVRECFLARQLQRTTCDGCASR